MITGIELEDQIICRAFWWDHQQRKYGLYRVIHFKVRSSGVFLIIDGERSPLFVHSSDVAPDVYHGLTGRILNKHLRESIDFGEMRLDIQFPDDGVTIDLAPYDGNRWEAVTTNEMNVQGHVVVRRLSLFQNMIDLVENELPDI